MIGNVAVTVQRPPGGLDENGDPADGDATTHRVNNCSVAPRLSTETTERAREGAVIGLTLYCPVGTDISRDDTIVIGDGPHQGTYRVEGEPADWQSGVTIRPAGKVVELTAAVG